MAVTVPRAQQIFASQVEGSARKIISRTLITLTGVANPFTRSQYSRLRQIENLLQTPLYQEGGLSLLKSLDRKTYNQYTRLSKSYKAAARSKARPGFVVIQRSVATRA
jgi:hypothetical protein